MADMCGPSNALSNFQKHSTVDRTLQQDRLITRQSPSQGFRSGGQNARHLDPEFEAFQAGQLPLDPSFQQPSHFPQQSLQPSSGPSSWASDFQRLKISSPSAHQELHNGFGGQEQLARSAGVDWHQEFGRQQNQMETPMLAQSQQQNAYTQSYNPMGMQAGMMPYGGFQPMQEHLQAQQHQPVEQFDDAAFERAFQEAAAAEVEARADYMEAVSEPVQEQSKDALQEHTQSQNSDIQRSLTLDDELLRSSLSPPDSRPVDQPLIGSDTIHDPNQPESPQLTEDDPDALARTAQKLVDSLSGDTRSKMQESEFMKLMRGFATGAQGIRGEEVVDNRMVGEKDEAKVV